MGNSSAKVMLRSGREIHLCELRQYLTYEGLLEGLPTVEGNDRRLARLIEEYRDRPHPGDPFVIPAAQTPIEINRRYPFGTPAALPDVTCIGRFTSDPARDRSRDCSGLVVIWHQDEFALPIAPAVLDQLRSLDWERYAADIIL